MKIGILILIFVMLIFVLLFMPIRVRVSFFRTGDEKGANAVLEFCKIKIRIYDSGKNPKNEKKEKDEKKAPHFDKESIKLEKWINIFENTKEDVGKVLRRIGEKALVFENIKVHAKFGFSDAMHTGIFTGTANGLVYGVLGVIHHNSRLKKMDVRLEPVFNETCFCAECECIVRSKLVHIIIIAINVLKILRKIRKIERRG